MGLNGLLRRDSGIDRGAPLRQTGGGETPTKVVPDAMGGALYARTGGVFYFDRLILRRSGVPGVQSRE